MNKPVQFLRSRCAIKRESYITQKDFIYIQITDRQ